MNDWNCPRGFPRIYYREYISPNLVERSYLGSDVAHFWRPLGGRTFGGLYLSFDRGFYMVKPQSSRRAFCTREGQLAPYMEHLAGGEDKWHFTLLSLILYVMFDFSLGVG
jgi:hypothetical protein